MAGWGWLGQQVGQQQVHRLGLVIQSSPESAEKGMKASAQLHNMGQAVQASGFPLPGMPKLLVKHT